jgi:uncharacterized membrane protein YfcA
LETLVNWLLDITALSPFEFTLLAIVSVIAGAVRGFTGFGLSAVSMAALVTFFAPAILIPILWWQEAASSVAMLKTGIKDADKSIALPIWIASIAGWPLGLWLTTYVAPDTSKLIALALVCSLAAALLFKLRLSSLNSKSGLYGTGFGAGIAAGLAHVGGMVVAIYVLNSDRSARQMRGALTLYLILGTISSFVIQTLFGVMDWRAVTRGLVFAAPSLIGLYVGSRLFIPKFKPFYRPICLALILGLALIGLMKLAL